MAYRKITDIRDTIGMRAVFYARVSTAEEEQLNAIELQIEENRGCIKDHGWKLVGEYIDRSKSGTMVKGRDDYQRLYEDLYEDLFDIVVIKDQERLQRNTLDWYLFINRVVQTGKLLFMYMDGKFYSPDDALITGVRAIIAEEFSRNLSKKLHNYHDHRIEKARQGQEIALQGSGNVYGWDKKDGKYYINPEQAKVRRLMCEGIMARKGSTLIAKELNDAGYRNTVGKPWKPMDIPKFVYDCKNVGTMIINKERHDFESKQTIKLPKEEWVYVENALPPIVTQEEWDLICKIHEERVIATGSDRRGKKTSGYSFSGKLVCGICGAPYWRKQRVSKDEYWVCSTKQTKGRRTRKRDSTMGKAGEINPLGCDNENISYNSLMEIMGVVSERLQANTDTIKQDMINWLTKLRKQLIEANGGHTEADLQRDLSRKSKLLDAYLDGILNKQEYQTKAEELDERIIQLKAETEKNKANSGDIAEIDKVLANIDEEVSRYVDGNEKLKVEYLLEHLEQVQIFPDKVIVIVPILSEGIVVEKAQYVSSNGSGKSTLLRTLSGVYEPDEGQVIIDGEPAFDNHKIKERCYYIADYPFFFNDSTVENMGKLLKNIYSTWDQQRFEELCEMFPIERKKKIINMSKGMQRQASLILAFAAKPKYLFLDEIFDGLDPLIRKTLKTLIIQDVTDRNMTCIIASHNLREIDDICDRIVMLHDGSLLTNEETDSLKNKIHKIQMAFKNSPSVKTLTEMNVQIISQVGNYFSVMARGDIDEIMEKLNSLNPVFIETMPSTLEEVFINEMEGAGYGK